MRYLLILLVIFCVEGNAQERRPRMSPQEFQAKQREFIAEHAELTEEEGDAFFPLYYELQDKKHELNRNAWKKAQVVRTRELSEEECNEVTDALADVKIECAMLEKEYLKKFKQILPAKKLMRVQMAEGRFQRELLKGMQRRQGSEQKKQ